MRFIQFLSASIAVLALSIAAAPAQGATETLPVCIKCLNPRVISKTGVGTANAAADAKVVAEDAAVWCAANKPNFKYCVQDEVKQGGDGARSAYHVTANCSNGQMRSLNGGDYDYASVWPDGPGKGRPMIKDPGGNIPRWESIVSGTGKARAEWDRFGGMSLTSQWEVLCPGVTPASQTSKSVAAPVTPPVPRAAGSVAAQAAPAAQPQGFPPPPAQPAATATASACTGKRYCDEVSSFAAIITDFRPSIYDNSTRLVSATVRFLNKTNRPLILGYVRNAGIAIDEQGNRYTLPSAENVRAIAEITGGRDFDPKFKVLPGQTADARFEFVWKWNGRDVIGQLAWDIDLTIREVNEVAPGQYRFGQEHALQFKAIPGRNTTNAAPTGLAPSSPLTQAPVIATAVAPNPPPPAGPPPVQEPDACIGKPRCYDAGPFVAEIMQGSLTREGNFQDRVVRLNIRFRNKTNEPLILAYVARTSVLSDNLGKRFEWGSGYDNSATGIGKVESSKADPQFVLRPGESRAATFTVFRRRPPRTDPDGSGYTYNVTIAQLEVLYNGQQIRTSREHTLTFPDFGLNGPSANPIGAPGAKPAPQSLKEAQDALRDVFKKKK